MFDFRLFPGTNFNRINLDWIFSKLKELQEGQETVTEAAEEATAAAEEATSAATAATQAASDAIEAIETVTETAEDARTRARAAELTAARAESNANTAISDAATASAAATNAATAAAAAQQTADGAVTAAATAQQTADGAVTAAATAQQTATGAASAAAAAQQTADGKISRSLFDLTAHTGNVALGTASNVTVVSNDLRYAFNDDYSIGKIYGNLLLFTTVSGTYELSTGIYVDVTSGFTIQSPCEVVRANSQPTNYNIISSILERISLGDGYLRVADDGEIFVRIYLLSDKYAALKFFPCLYFFSDFGDS